MFKNPFAKKCAIVGVTAFCVIAAALLLFFCFYHFGIIREMLSQLVRILMPFILGAIIAYLLAPLYNLLVRNLRHLLRPKLGTRMSNSLSVGISVLISISATVLLLSGLVAMVVPQFVESVSGILNNTQEYIDKVSGWLESFFASNPEIAAEVELALNNLSAELGEWMRSGILSNLQTISGTMGNVSSLVQGLISGFAVLFVWAKNVIIGLIVAAYILVGKGTLIAQSKKLLYSIFKVNTANTIIDRVRYVHSVFGGFILGKLLDSLIIGILCFIGTGLLRIPYAMVVSVIIGVTNVIPFFGPIIGAVPCALLILLNSPIKCIYFIIFVLALQQFDGNILGPKILGNSTGLNSFFVLLAILLFGGLFGFVGMIIGVPLFAVLYSLVKNLVETRLERRKMSANTRDYVHLDHIQRNQDGSVSYLKGKNPTSKAEE